VPAGVTRMSRWSSPRVTRLPIAAPPVSRRAPIIRSQPAGPGRSLRHAEYLFGGRSAVSRCCAPVRSQRIVCRRWVMSRATQFQASRMVSDEADLCRRPAVRVPPSASASRMRDTSRSPASRCWPPGPDREGRVRPSAPRCCRARARRGRRRDSRRGSASRPRSRRPRPVPCPGPR